MMLKVLLPFQIFVDTTEVVRIVAETSAGSVGLLPNRLDCVAVLVPGILIYETPQGGEVFLAVDEGVLVKTGGSVRISVRRAIAGTDLEQLHASLGFVRNHSTVSRTPNVSQCQSFRDRAVNTCAPA